MKWYAWSRKKIEKCSTLLVFILIGIVSFGIFWGCGKLNNDVDRPTSPIGTTGGIPVPINPQSSVGTYKLTLYATPNTLPADMVTFVTVHAKLEDSSGRRVENFTINFKAELGYLDNGPTWPAILSTSAEGITNEWGTVSLYYYGARKGSEILQATVDLDSDGTVDLMTTTLIIVTEGPGVPGTGVAGVRLTVSPTFFRSDVGDCTEPTLTTTDFILDTQVWDETGSKAARGVRVEFSGSGILPGIINYADTDSTGHITQSYTYSTITVGTHEFKVTATVVINGKTYTDSVSYIWNLTCGAAEPTAVPSSVIEFTVYPSTLPIGNSVRNITVSVTTEGVAAAGKSVTFSVSSSNPDITASLNPTVATTNSSGTAATVLTVTGATAGDTLIITAVASGATTVKQTITVTSTTTTKQTNTSSTP